MVIWDWGEKIYFHVLWVRRESNCVGFWVFHGFLWTFNSNAKTPPWQNFGRICLSIRACLSIWVLVNLGLPRTERPSPFSNPSFLRAGSIVGWNCAKNFVIIMHSNLRTAFYLRCMAGLPVIHFGLSDGFKNFNLVFSILHQQMVSPSFLTFIHMSYSLVGPSPFWPWKQWPFSNPRSS